MIVTHPAATAEKRSTENSLWAIYTALSIAPAIIVGQLGMCILRRVGLKN